jgi:hypothetical protein
VRAVARFADCRTCELGDLIGPDDQGEGCAGATARALSSARRSASSAGDSRAAAQFRLRLAQRLQGQAQTLE